MARRPRNVIERLDLRRVLRERDGDNCHWCGRALLFRWTKRKTRIPLLAATFDHLIPECHAGGWHPDNLVLACHECNNDRGQMSVDDFRIIRSDRAHLQQPSKQPNMNEPAQD